MPAASYVPKLETIQVRCPYCGHPAAAAPVETSLVCRACGRPIRVQPKPNPAQETGKSAPEKRRITCFDCAAELDVEVSLPSVKCQRCGTVLDLRDYRVYDVGSKRIRTKGAFIVEPRGYLFNTEAVVGVAVIKGRFRGTLVAEDSLTIYSSAQIQGSFRAARLIIPAAQRFHWQETIEVGSAEIAGELCADLSAAGTIVLKSTARMFGRLEANNLGVEEGAVVVGPACVGSGGGLRRDRGGATRLNVLA